MVFALFICRPIVPSCSLPKPFGRSSTSRSSTRTSQASRNSTQKSPNNVSSSPNGPRKKKHEPDSIGAQANQSELITRKSYDCPKENLWDEIREELRTQI